MPKAQHHPEDQKVYHIGCDADSEQELIKTGFSLDMLNMRATVRGAMGAVKKIFGEVLKWLNIDNNCSTGTGQPLLNTYKCIGDCRINGHVMEFWADELAVYDSYIRVDGQIVCMSPNFPITVAFPLQLDTDDSCVGGDVFITDFNVPPMMFNVEDLMINSGMIVNPAFPNVPAACTSKYFADFNLALYVLQLSFQVDHPMFIELLNSASGNMIAIGSGGGNLEVGAYQYAIQFVDATGNTTRLSPFTPLITVPKSLSSDSAQFKHIMTEGGEGGLLTLFGIHFRVRLTNINQYVTMNIVRASYKGQTPIGTIPILEVIYAEPLAGHQVYDILDFFDAGTVTPLAIITEAEETDSMGGIQAAKAIRYFNKRVHLMNIKYAGRSIDNLGFNQSSLGVEMFPFMKKVGQKGFADPYHSTYDRSYMNGEKYGMGVVLWDPFANRTFAKSVPNFNNYQFPNRRDKMNADNKSQSFEGRVRAATSNAAGNPAGEVDDTFEVFDHYNATNKPDICSFINILDHNPGVGLCLGHAAGRGINATNAYCAPSSYDTYCAAWPLDTRVFCHDLNYKPFTPTPINNNVDGHKYWVNPCVKDVLNAGSALGYFDPSEVIYNPLCFGLNYYSQGIALQGLNNIPSFASGFSVVRSEPAKRVVAQGVGFYRLVNGAGWTQAVRKDTNAFCFYSPDTDTSQGIVDSTIMADLVANPGNYQIEVQSALGFFTESFNALEGDAFGLGASVAVDLISYARILRDKNTPATAQINPGESAHMGINGADTYNYVGFGKWREPQALPRNYTPFPKGQADTQSGLGVFQINVAKQVSGLNADDGLGVFTSPASARGNFLIIEIDAATSPAGGSIYNTIGTGSVADATSAFSAPNMQMWHEPIYIVNIIKKNANNASNNVNDFIDTGTYVKVKSIIGISDGTDPQKFLLVDERWEDCCPTLNAAWQNFTAMSATDRFITVVDAGGNERKWLNVTYKNSGARTAILTDIQTNGFHVTSGVNVYGVYTHSSSFPNALSDVTDVKLIFSQFDPAFVKGFFIPPKGQTIRVDYDNTVPVRVFGGDCVSGETVFSPIDNKYNKTGYPTTSTEDFKMDVGFPFNHYRSNPRNFIVRNTDPSLGGFIKDWSQCDTDMTPLSAAKIRQLVVMFTCTSRIHTPYFVQNSAAVHAGTPTWELSYPAVNYIPRPFKWDSSNVSQHIWPGYFVDNPGEDAYWGWGGFRFQPLTNIDYSKEEDIQVFSSKPATGFIQKTDFCTRDIWSAQRLTNVQNDPNVRTFPALNFKDIEDRQGAIKFAWDAASNAGGNLYAFCERGIALLLTNKQILQEMSGNQLGTIGVTSVNEVITEEWISKTIGMNDEFWRSAAEFDNLLFFSNKNSSYLFTNNKAQDIGRNKYHKRLYNNFLSKVLPNYQTDMCAVYDTLNNEYWVSFKQHRNKIHINSLSPIIIQTSNSANPWYVQDGDIIEIYGSFSATIRLPLIFPFQITQLSIVNSSSATSIVIDTFGVVVTLINPGDVFTFTHPSGIIADPVIVTVGLINEYRGTVVYSRDNEHWFGRNDYDFDKMLSFDNLSYGMRDNETYLLNKGFLIRGNPVRSELIGVCNVEENSGKEFIRFRSNSDTMPTRVEFFDDIAQSDANAPETILDTVANAYALKKRDGYEQYIPRRTAAPNRRFQGRKMVFKIIHITPNEEFKVISSTVQYKKIL